MTDVRSVNFALAVEATPAAASREAPVLAYTIQGPHDEVAILVCAPGRTVDK